MITPARDFVGQYLLGNRTFGSFALVLLMISMALLSSCALMGSSASKIDTEADKALLKLIEEVPEAEDFLNQVSGYLVFPSVVKMGIGFGGETGTGVLRVGGVSVAYYRMSSGSIGLQLGIQSKSMVIAFRTLSALNQFRNSTGWQAGVDGSITLLNVGANKNFKTDTFSEPVAAIVFGSKGLMYNLTFEGTKFTKLNR